MFNYVTLVSDRNSGGAYMESPKIKVLGIAPYEAMKNVMEKLARKRPQMEMDVYVGDLKRGLISPRRISRETMTSSYRGAAQRK